MRKILSALVVLFYILNNILSIATAVSTDGKASSWTREKAAHLAQSTLFNADTKVIDSLFAAGSAIAAVNLLFPDPTGPNRTEFTNYIMNYTSSGFNWGDSGHTTRLYQLMYASDPYEAKRKLFSLYEDIFAVNVNTDKDITYQDVYDLHTLLFDNMFGNYQLLVKKVLNNNGGKGDYAAGKFLDLFNQQDPKKPNENYARELLQLFLMGEYKPSESKENNDIRNYEESDVVALSKILTGLNADPITHRLSFDITKHYSGSPLLFLSSGAISINPPYYNSASGTVDPMAILAPVNGNNGLYDNTIEYIFAKRSDQIALFLADRITRFYMYDTPTRAELDTVAEIIKNNNFEMLPSIKSILVLDLMYSDNSMNSIRYKNPLELNFGTIRFLHGNVFSGIVADPNVYDSSLLRRLNWTPYFPGSVFGRDGFDDSLKWSSTSNQGSWMNATNYFTYRMTGTGVVDFSTMLGNQKKEITTGLIPVMSYTDNSFSGILSIVSGTLELGNPVMSLATATLDAVDPAEIRIEEQIWRNGYPLDPVVSILGGENLEFTKSELYQWIHNDFSFIPQTDVGVLDALLVADAEPTMAVHTGSANSTGTSIVIPDTGSLDDTTTVMVDMRVILDNTGILETTEAMNTGETLSVMNEPKYSIDTMVTLDESMILENTGVALVPLIISGDIAASGSLDTPLVALPISDSGMTSTGIDSPIVSTEPQLETNITVNAVTISTGSVTLPIFKVVTNLGTITIASGTYVGDTRTLLIHSGVLTQNGSGTQILSGTIVFDITSKLIADTISPDQIIDLYETYIYGEKRLQGDTRDLIKNFITQDASGALIPVAPTNIKYFNQKIRGLLSILLSQPEYALLHGYDTPMTVDPDEQHFLDNIPGKVFFVELYGGNDHLSNIIPKDEYNTYLDYRTNQTGSIAITGTGLVDIGDFYMNAALAYSSTGGLGFKDLYDKGYLKIFNRVGGYRHSSDHSAAAKQISSYDSTTSIAAEGLFGHLIKKEFEGSNTISLGSRRPNVYRAGHYVNLGGNIILSNPLDSGGLLRAHMETMVTIARTRKFPGNTKNLFKDVGRISEIGKLSLSQGGAPGASGDMNSIFNFSKILMNNNIGRAFYMGGYGGYDTHENQFNGLNRNLNFVSNAVTNFFNSVKDTQDVTIVIFSEFGRTNKTNGDLGTDHGDGGGMFVITSNANLRNTLQEGTYGNMSIKNSRTNSLGVGIDYRSVYGSIFKSLYNLDGSTYFGTGVDILNDISLTPNKISLLNYSYQASGTTPYLNVELIVSGDNFNPGKSGYARLLSGTGLIDQKITRITEKVVPEGYLYSFRINPNTQPYYTLESFSNQYALTAFSGTLTGATYPIVLASNVREISQSKTSILRMFADTIAPSTLAGMGVILENTGSNILNIPNNMDIKIHFASGVTRVTDLTYASGSTTWRGGFILGEKIDKAFFIPSNALIVSDNKTLQKQNITRLFKIGADVRGVGMKLNQAVGIEFVGLPVGEMYRAISSQDGISWDDVESTGKWYESNSTGSILVNADHFSYFALLSNNAVEVPPTCTITINPNSIINGDTALLSWSLLNTLTGTLNPGNTILGSSGSFLITPPSNTTTPYTISVMNSAGSNSCTASVIASVVVLPPPPVIPPPTCTITINPNSIINGDTALLSWSLLNTLTGTLNPGNTILGSSGSFLITPPSNTTTPYTISVMNSAGSNSCTASVIASVVVLPPPPVIPVPTPVISGPGGPASGGGGSSVIIGMIDTCFGGDHSGNYYDGSCVPPTALPQKNTITVPIDMVSKIGTVYVPDSMNQLIADLKRENTKFVDTTTEQRIRRIALEIWRQNNKNPNTAIESTILTINLLLDIRQVSENRAVQSAINRIIDILEQFIDGQISPTPVVQHIYPQKNADIVESNSSHKYVSAERSVTFRKSGYVGFSNILGYLSRNTQVSILEEVNGWTRVLYDGVEGYIKSRYLRDENSADFLRSSGNVIGNEQRGYIIAKQSGYVRISPYLRARIAAVVYRNQSVIILDAIPGWYEILLENGVHGYIRKELVHIMDFISWY